MSLTPGALGFADAIASASSSVQLDDAAKHMWSGVSQGILTYQDAEKLQACIDERRARFGSGRVPEGPLTRIASTLVRRFTPRRRQWSPDKQASKERRRDLSGALPSSVRRLFTEAQRAVLAIIAGEVKRHGVCDLVIDKIAALAGCCRTSVIDARREAIRLGIIKVTYRPRRGAKSLSNVVQIVCRDWLAWIKRGPAAHRATGCKTFSSCEKSHPTKTIEKKEGLRWEVQRGASPRERRSFGPISTFEGGSMARPGG